jgi:hypothetical protein
MSDQRITTRRLHPELLRKLRRLLQTGFYGWTMGDALERLACERLQQMEPDWVSPRLPPATTDPQKRG